jgi:hypothetical protein
MTMRTVPLDPLKIIGTIINSILFLGGVMFAFRYVARNQVSKIKEFLIFTLPIMISMLFIGGVLIVDSFYKTRLLILAWQAVTSLALFFFCLLFSIQFGRRQRCCL